MAGGLNVGVNIISKSCEVFFDNDYIAICPNTKEYRNIHYKNLNIIFLPKKYEKFSGKFFLKKWENKIINEINPDVIFNLCNTPLKTKIKQLTLLHWPYAVYPESKVWQMMGIKEKIIRKLKLLNFKFSTNNTSNFTVQTEVMQKRLKEIYKVQNVYVVPNSVNLLFEKNENKDFNDFLDIQENFMYFIYPTRYYPHKNIEVLVDVAKIINRNNDKIKILLTLDKSENEVKNILNQVSLHNLDKTIINLGQLSFAEISCLYTKVDAVLMPTILESLGLPFLETMSFKKPLFTSALDFSKSLCKDYAVFFDPFSPQDIYDKIKLLDNKEYIDNKILLGDKILKDYTNSWEEIVVSYNKILKNIL